MLMVCHHLNPPVPEDLAFAESRIRPSTIAAEDILHDLGAISIIVVRRPGHGPHRRGRHADLADRARHEAPPRLRCPATARPTTTAPAATSRSTPSTRPSPRASTSEVGSVETGKLADLVLWDPAFFGVKPHLVIKGGQIAYAQMGDANASIPTPQPVLPRPMFGAIGRAPAAQLASTSWPTAAIDDGAARTARARQAVRRRSQHPRRHQGGHAREQRAAAGRRSTPTRFAVRIDGELVEPHPATELPMAQRYFLF